MVVQGLLERGHQVTLFASDDSSAPCRLVPFGHRRSGSVLVELRQLFTLFYHLVRHRGDFDVVHCFGRLMYLLPLLPLRMPKIQSYGFLEIDRRRLQVADRLARGTLVLTACSNSCAALCAARAEKNVGRWKVVYNGVPLRKYHFSGEYRENSYLVFLGRLEPIKGAHTAIAVARATGKRLIIAGTIAGEDNLDYFKRDIEPEIDGDQIQYIGPVDDRQKNDLLGGALALLFPIEWEEPFGLVMIEAMACGTPVIGFRRGAVPEIVTDGVDGFVCASVQEMVSAVHRLSEIDRAACRKKVESCFSEAVVLSAYEKLYKQLLGIDRE